MLEIIFLGMRLFFGLNKDQLFQRYFEYVKKVLKRWGSQGGYCVLFCLIGIICSNFSCVRFGVLFGIGIGLKMFFQDEVN